MIGVRRDIFALRGALSQASWALQGAQGLAPSRCDSSIAFSQVYQRRSSACVVLLPNVRVHAWLARPPPRCISDLSGNPPICAADDERRRQQTSDAAVRADARPARRLDASGAGRLSPAAVADDAHQGGRDAEQRLEDGGLEEGLRRPQLSWKGDALN